MAYHSQQGVDTSVARIFNTYGPRMRANDGRAIPTFLRQALAGKPVTVFGDGSQTRSFCYVDDLVRGIVLLAESDEHLPGQPREPRREDAARARRDDHPSSPGRRARSSTRHCRSTTRRSASPTSPVRSRSWAGSRRWLSRTAFARRSPRSATRPPSAPRELVSDLGARYEEHHRERRDEGDFVFVPERIPLFRAGDRAGTARARPRLPLRRADAALPRREQRRRARRRPARALAKAAALGIEPVQANVEEPLPFEDASFDAVVAGELLEHLRFPRRSSPRSGGSSARGRPRRLRAERVPPPEPAALRCVGARRRTTRRTSPVLAVLDPGAARRLRAGRDRVRGWALPRAAPTVARPRPRLPRLSSRRSLAAPERGSPRDVGLVDHVPVARDVAVLAADHEEHEVVLVARVRHLPRRRRVDVEEAARPEDALLALHLDPCLPAWTK